MTRRIFFATPRALKRFRAISTIDAVRENHYDYLWLTVSSTHLRQGDWLKDILSAIGDETAVVLTTPGQNDYELLLQHFPHPARVIQGQVGFLSWQAPLKGARFSVVPPKMRQEPSIAYIVLPDPALFSANKPGRTLCDQLTAAGYPAKPVEDQRQATIMQTVMVMAFLLGLEKHGWSFSEFKAHGDTIAKAARAATEGVTAQAYSQKTKPPSTSLLPIIFRLVVSIGPLLAPFDLEAYIGYHFSKVGDQTLLVIGDLIKVAKDAGLPHAAMQELLDAVRTRREAKTAAAH